MHLKDCIEELTGKFPDHAGNIAHMLDNDEDFREIVDDYRYCRFKIQRLQEYPVENRPIIRHYERTLRELEEEIGEHLCS